MQINDMNSGPETGSGAHDRLEGSSRAGINGMNSREEPPSQVPPRKGKESDSSKLKELYRQLWGLLNEDIARGKVLRLGYFILLYYFAGFFSHALEFVASDVNSPVHRALATLITQVSVTVLHLFYQDIQVDHDFIITISGKQCIQLFPGCNGFNPTLRILLSICLYPMVIRRKLLIVPLTIIVMVIAVTLHFMVLIPVSYEIPQWYDFSHNYFTHGLFYGFYFLCWLILENFRRPKERAPGARR